MTVIPPGTWPADGADAPSEEVATYVDLLNEHGIAASGEVLRELEAAPALAAHVAAMHDAVLVVTCPRSRDRASHWYGTTRALIRTASCPCWSCRRTVPGSAPGPWVRGSVGRRWTNVHVVAVDAA